MASAVSTDTDISWNELAQSIIDGQQLTAEQALGVLHASDFDLPQLLDAAWRVRSHHFGNQVQLYYLKNAKSGLCPEDCGYCSQNAKSTAPIDKYPMLSEDEIVAGAKKAYDAQARTYCIVTSGRGPSNKDVDHVARAVQRIKTEYGLHICCCLGLLDDEQAVALQAAGVDRINHNLNTSRKFYDSICSTHTFDDRLDTLKSVRNAGMELCCGVIAGMGEEHQDLVDVAMELQGMKVESIPVNFLNSIEGTQLEAVQTLNPRFCLKTLCMFRFANPATEIRVAGGREVNLRSMQAMSLYPANSLFVSDYLTTAGQAAEADFQMIEDMGFEIVTGDAESHALWQQRRQSSASASPEGSCGTDSSCGSEPNSFSC
jgi:biotin synthase